MAHNWNHDEGINLPMINDVVRNSFYEKIIKQGVKGKRCTDVGFGTGILSLLALKHGATGIIAYEADGDRFELGQQIIKRMGLEEKIDLRHAIYNDKMRETDVVMHELIFQQLWGGHLQYILPADKSDALMLPCEFAQEIWLAEVSDNFAKGCVEPVDSFDYFDQKHFAPGVDVGEEFINVISDISGKGKTTQTKLQDGIHQVYHGKPTFWGYRSAWHYLKAHGKPIASMEYNQRPANTTEKLDINLEAWQGKNLLLMPRGVLKGFGHSMYIDEGHWGPCRSSVLVTGQRSQITFTQDFWTGDIDWQ
jgi:hypothetical protein